MARARHPGKEIKAALRFAEGREWRVGKCTSPLPTHEPDP